jgi:IS30 family transposase
MKCVCPMGGDRTCPDDCLLAVWANLPDDDRKVRRKPIAEKLYEQGFTMRVIATQLGVSEATISNDLVNSLTTKELKPAKTATNPKGAGRHKGSVDRKPRPKQTDHKVDQIVALAEQGLTSPEIANEIGVEGRAVRHVLHDVATARKAEAQIDPATLSLSAQQKLEAAIRQHQRKLDLQFEARVREEARKRMDELSLPHWQEQIAKAKELYDRRTGLMDKATFNTIRRALHPDSRQSISDKLLGDAFGTFMKLEKYLLNEKDSPTEWPTIPSTVQEWDKMRTRPKTRATGPSSLRPK